MGVNVAEQCRMSYWGKGLCGMLVGMREAEVCNLNMAYRLCGMWMVEVVGRKGEGGVVGADKCVEMEVVSTVAQRHHCMTSYCGVV